MNYLIFWKEDWHAGVDTMVDAMRRKKKTESKTQETPAQGNTQETQDVNAEFAIHELQQRLLTLGYRLGDEIAEGHFGEMTAAALTSFKVSMSLGNDDFLDQATWAALRDASMRMGDRLLYLHRPSFRGRDVADLQAALAALGFACATDGLFEHGTEYALHECQENMGLEATGILDNATLTALKRLRHAWEGKRGFPVDDIQALLAVRSVETLENTSICFFGVDESTRAVANRIANLALATTAASKIVSASALATEPGSEMLLIGLEQTELKSSEQVGSGADKPLKPEEAPDIPVVRAGESLDLEAQCTHALAKARKGSNRIVISISGICAEGDDSSAASSQKAATIILNALCEALNTSTSP